MYEPESNKKVAALVFLILVIVSAVAGYFISIWAFSSEDANPKQKTSSSVSKKSESKKSEETFGIKVDDPSKAAEDIKDEKTLKFLQEISQYDESYPTAYGDINAPLTVVEFSDFSCPMCAKFHQESYDIVNKLVDAGKVRIKYMPFAVFKADGSDVAAAGAIAAGKQGKFREYMNLAFSKATTSGHQSYNKDSVISLAKEAGVENIEEFTKVINDPAIYKELDENVLKYSSWGINGTPATVVGKAFLNGAVPKEYVAATLVDQLKKVLK
ncbi:thioredoxin domain-containing protein [Actinomyces sp. zg-332]|uniref:DsbA family protein n=1 Tax=Actinomyces sp. zg-332 TaxID=2708340 RepID=UPI0014234FC5|nr:thioredoxin domain-containing protein [Actinomyces sp. zg-332]QPK94115.1 thioredoxin domain-containing protein [Actinomyces sp. zg-332]